jgi:hypothetical protein
MAGHTPGPWTVDPEPNKAGNLEVCVGDEAITYVGCGWSPEVQANARLIAAAPEMYEALMQIAELDGDCEQQRFKLTRFQSAQIARAALNQLRGTHG